MNISLDSYKSCNLCPHQCEVNRVDGKKGICKAPAQLKVGRAALHFWEEPPLVGEQGSGAVFFAYCPLHCVYCQNKRLADGEGIEISLDQLEHILLRLQNQEHAANINLVTPTHYASHIAEVLRKCKGTSLTIPVMYNTSGYESAEVLSKLKGLIDIYLTDYKYAEPSLARTLSKAPHYEQVALLALKEMLSQTGYRKGSQGSLIFNEESGLAEKGVIVRHLVLPGHIDNSLKALTNLKTHFGTGLTLSIMSQFTLLDSCENLADYGLADKVSPDEYEQVLDYADFLGFEDYFWQEGEANKESFIPQFDGTGVLD